MSTTVLPAGDRSVPRSESSHQPPTRASRVDGRGDRDAHLGARMVYSRLIGALFLAAFVLYGVGNGLVTSVVSAPDLLSTVSATRLERLLPGLEAGMIPKMEACLRAVRGGVPEATVIDGRLPHSVLLEVFTPEGVGTMVLPDTTDTPQPSGPAGTTVEVTS